MSIKREYEYSPSQVVYFSQYFFLSLLLALSLYFFFNQNIVDFALNVGHHTIIQVQDISLQNIKDTKQVISYISIFSAVILIINMFILYLTIKTTLYIVIPDKKIIKIKKGIIEKRIDIIKIHKIEDIDINMSILERFLGLGTLTIYTSGDMSAISDKLTFREKSRLNEVNKNVVMNYMSIRKILSIQNPQALMNLIIHS